MFSQPELAGIARQLAQTGVTDLVVNGANYAAVMVGGSWQPVEPPFASELELAAAAKILAALGSKQVDFAHPFASVEIQGKIRAHILLSSAINQKTHIAIRVHAHREVALAQLVQVKAISQTQLELLSKIIVNRETFLISGRSGAGKTTLLRAMLNQASQERVITIEDVAELKLSSYTTVELVAREANLEGKGELSLDRLLIESLRMRPDRIVIGEVRSRELITLLQASSSGHCAAATIHAESAAQIEKRLQAIAIANSIDARFASALFKSSVNWLIHINNSLGQRSVEIMRNE